MTEEKNEVIFDDYIRSLFNVCKNIIPVMISL